MRCAATMRLNRMLGDSQTTRSSYWPPGAAGLSLMSGDKGGAGGGVDFFVGVAVAGVGDCAALLGAGAVAVFTVRHDHGRDIGDGGGRRQVALGVARGDADVARRAEVE